MSRALRHGLAWLSALAVGASGLASTQSLDSTLTAAELADLVRSAERVVIVFQTGDRAKEYRDALVENRAWVERLAATIESGGALLPRPYCFCISTPEIEFYYADRPMLRLTLHHESKLRLFGRVRGDFDIGVERKKAVRALIQEHRAHAKERFLPPKQKKNPDA